MRIDAALIADAVAKTKNAEGTSVAPSLQRDFTQEISEAIEHYTLRTTERSKQVVGAPRREKLTNLADEVTNFLDRYEELLRTPGLTAPLIWALEPDAEHQLATSAEHPIREMIRALRLHQRWLNEASKLAATATPRRGRPSQSSHERELVRVFADIYEHYTDRRAGRSSTETKASGATDHDGPFVRFVEAVIASCPTLSSLSRSWGDTIRRALEDRKRDPQQALYRTLRDGHRIHLMDHLSRDTLRQEKP